VLNHLPDPVNVVIIGASRGIGLEFVRRFARLDKVRSVVAGSRNPDAATELHSLSESVVRARVDVGDESTVRAFAAVAADKAPLSIVINTAGLLHDDTVRPEKRLEDIDPEAMANSFAVNAIGPALVAKHFIPLLNHSHTTLFATLSARVGSISDNRLGGWYSYRAAKAAQNMLTKNIAIEARRRAPNAIVVGLHPGTVDTGLSKPFQANVPPEKLFGVERSVDHLLRVVDTITPADSGKVFAWDGTEVAA